MSEPSPPDPLHPDRDDMQRQVGHKEDRKLRARRRADRTIWFGLGMFGLIGWSVAIPTVLGIFIGLWIDENWPSRYSWTLMLLIVGVALGCANAWRWIHEESQPDRD
nr:AtpZ/AtpI family protein [Maioricimonas rarisocia]